MVIYGGVDGIDIIWKVKSTGSEYRMEVLVKKRGFAEIILCA